MIDAQGPMVEPAKINTESTLHPYASYGPTVLGLLCVNYSVDGDGQVLRYPSGEPVNCDRIQTLVRDSDNQLSSAQAANQIIINDHLGGVTAHDRAPDLHTWIPRTGE